jgi:hypothetical protein
MFLAAQLDSSLKRNLRNTDVWSAKNHVFKLAGAGSACHDSKLIKANMGRQQSPRETNALLKQQRRIKVAENNKSIHGHMPLRTFRDNQTFEKS